MLILRDSNRRNFLRDALGGVAAIGVGATLPECFARAVRDEATKDSILIVVQMSGGNDGLNTIIPYADEGYVAARPKLAIPKADVLKLDADTGLHPSLRGVHELLQAGKFAAVRSVGYENPNRSHFESMDIWHTCQRKDQPRPNGWLGRFLDSQPSDAGGDVAALHLGSEQQPFALASLNVRVPTVKDLAEFQLRGSDKQTLLALLQGNQPEEASLPTNDLLAFLQSSTTSAIAASNRVTEASQSYRTETKYPDTDLGRKLRIVAQLIDAGLATRIYYVQHDGFDTHAQQAQTHSVLLRQWSEAVSALMNDLTEHDHDNRVCVMTFSEFGRRVSENASEGTDHGAAGPMYFCGGLVQPGIIGKVPDLADLQDGDLKHEHDFRQVYATVLNDWLRADADRVLGSQFKRLPIFV